MKVADARRLDELETENAKLKHLVAERMLAIDGSVHCVALLRLMKRLHRV